MAYRGALPGRDPFKDYELMDNKTLVATRRELDQQIGYAERNLAKLNKQLSVLETMIEERENGRPQISDE